MTWRDFGWFTAGALCEGALILTLCIITGSIRP